MERERQAHFMGREKRVGFVQAVRENWRALLYFAGYLRKYWMLHVVVVGLSQLVVLLGLVNPYLMKIVMDDAFVNRDLHLFLVVSLAGAVIFLLSSVFSRLASYYSFLIKRNVSFDINRDTVSHLYSLNIKFFRDTSTGENLYKINFDIERITALITDTAIEILNMVPTFVLTIAIVLVLDWRMGVIALLLGMMFYLSAGYYAKKRRDIMWDLIQERQEIFKRLKEALSNIYLVKASGKEADETETHVEKTREMMKKFLDNRKAEIQSEFTSGIINNSILAVITLYGGYQIIQGTMTLGTFMSIMLYLGRIVNFHLRSSDILQRIAVDLISCQRIKSIVDQTPEERHTLAPQNLGDIEFKDVNFHYAEGIPVLKNFSMRVKPGEWVGLAGFSGSGKTTAINILLGLYEPNSGEVLIDGIPYHQIDFKYVRQNAGVVLQEPYMWNATIQENLTYLKKAPKEDVEAVVRNLKLEDVIKNQPQKYDTNVGETACKLSEGQKQRLSFARTMLRKPTLLIFDEALSFVDNETSAAILKNLRHEHPNMTVLLVSHNPRVLEQTDRIYFITKSGNVISGTHSELSRREEYQQVLKLAGTEPK